MMHGVVIVWGTLLLFWPSALAFQDGKDQPAPPAAMKEPATRLAELEKELELLRKLVLEMQEQQRKSSEEVTRSYNELKKLLQDGLLKQADDRTQAEMANQRLLRDVQDLSRRVDDLRTELNRLQAERRSFYGPSPAPAASPLATATGTVAFVNSWWLPVTIVLDGMMVTLQPGETRVFTKSAGVFGYEVLGAQGYVTRSLSAGQTFTVQIGPR